MQRIGAGSARGSVFVGLVQGYRLAALTLPAPPWSRRFRFQRIGGVKWRTNRAMADLNEGKRPGIPVGVHQTACLCQRC